MKTSPTNHVTTQNPSAKNAVALKAFFAITKHWDLCSEDEKILLGVSTSTLYLWKKEKTGALSTDTLERISYILGIYKALHILLPNKQAANEWIKKPNKAPLFNGKSALHKLLKGHVVDLSDVRRYLDAERGW